MTYLWPLIYFQNNTPIASRQIDETVGLNEFLLKDSRSRNLLVILIVLLLVGQMYFESLDDPLVDYCSICRVGWKIGDVVAAVLGDQSPASFWRAFGDCHVDSSFTSL